jgi:hypothetical protein
MSAAPLPPGCSDPGGAADVKSGLELRLSDTSATESQGAADLADFRFQRSVARLYRLGPRVIAEMLVELGRQRLIRTEIEVLVERYANLDPGLLAAVAADRFPPLPTRQIWGRP